MKTFKYELSHQSNLIKIGNMLDDLHEVHVPLAPFYSVVIIACMASIAGFGSYLFAYNEVKSENKTPLERTAESGNPASCQAYSSWV